MKGQSIFIDSSATIVELHWLHRNSCNEADLMILLDIYKQDGYEAAKQAASTNPFQLDNLCDLVDYEALTKAGWVSITSSIKMHGYNQNVITFSDSKEGYTIKPTGECSSRRIYQIRLKATPKAKKKLKPDLLIPAFPLE